MTTSKYFIPLVEKPLVTPRRLSPRQRAAYEAFGIDAFPNRGFGANPPIAPKPARNTSGAEKVISGPTNASVAFTVDRGVGGGLTDGLGGQGMPAAAIDLCAGHMGPYAREVDDKGDPVRYNPNFQIDSARVYIAESCNIDENMQLPDGKLGERRMSSAVGLVADDVNIQAKGEGGLKLAAYSTNRNSSGLKNLKNPGIDLMVDDGEDQQYLVKGQNLLELLATTVEQVDELRGTMEQFVRLQGNCNDKIMVHNHNSPFYAQATAPSFNLMFEGYKQCFQRVADVEKGMIFSIINKETGLNNYFNPVAAKYILSGLVTTG